MSRYKIDNKYIIPEIDLGYIEVMLKDVEKKRKKLIEKGRLSEDFPEIDFKVNKIDKETLFKLIENDENLTTLEKYQYKKDINKNPNQLLAIELEQDKMPTLQGWKVLGFLEKADRNAVGNDYVMNSFNANDPIPSQYRYADPCNCDHCNQRRNRLQTFILQNDETNEYLQVGSACMKDFVKEESLEMLMLYSSIRELFKEYIELGTRGSYVFYVDKEKVIENVVRIDDEIGEFISIKNEQLGIGKISTTKLLNCVMDYSYYENFKRYLNSLREEKEISFNMLENIKEKIEKLIEKLAENPASDNTKERVKEISEFFKNNPPTDNDNEFYVNMQRLVSAEDPYMNSKYVGRIAYCNQYYKNIIKNLNPVEKEEINYLKSEIYMASEEEVQSGIRVEEIIVSLDDIAVYDSNYGEVAYHTFRTLDNKKLKWSASNRLDCFSYQDYEDYMSIMSKINIIKNEGNKMYLKLSFSITELKKDKKDVPETRISRVRIIPNEQGEFRFYENLEELNLKTNNYINIKGKYNLTEFKVIDIEEGFLSKNVKGYKISVELRDGTKKEILSTTNFDLSINDIVKVPLKILGKEIVGIKEEKMKKQLEFSNDPDTELTDLKYEKYNPNEDVIKKIQKKPKMS